MYFRRYTQGVADGRCAAAGAHADGGAPRYAIYFAPPPSSALWRFGCAWLGRDAITGADIAPAPLADLEPADIARWTAGARRYGWHATLKAPFRLAAPYQAADLYREAARAATALPCADIGVLTVVEIDGFVALCPRVANRVVDAVACECTRGFDYLRAPSTTAERAKRRESGLSPQQQRMDDRWGYPYCMEEFRFHMTLTDRIGAEERMRVIAAVQGQLPALGERRMRLDALCIFRQPSPEAPFSLIRRCCFDGTVEVYRDE